MLQLADLYGSEREKVVKKEGKGRFYLSGAETMDIMRKRKGCVEENVREEGKGNRSQK